MKTNIYWPFAKRHSKHILNIVVHELGLVKLSHSQCMDFAFIQKIVHGFCSKRISVLNWKKKIHTTLEIIAIQLIGGEKAKQEWVETIRLQKTRHTKEMERWRKIICAKGLGMWGACFWTRHFSAGPGEMHGITHHNSESYICNTTG